MPALIPAEQPIFWLVQEDGSNGVTQLPELTAVSPTVTLVHGEGAAAYLAAAVAGGGSYPPLPAQGEPLEQGQIYDYDGTLLMVRQAHTRTEHAPEDVPALFLVWRPDAGDVLDWVAGEQVFVGTLRIYAGQTWRCLQAHVTQADWTPPNVPALWQAMGPPPGPDEWAPGVAYSIGDVVTYNGAEYQCRQSHTSLVGWEPPNVPALWLAL